MFLFTGSTKVNETREGEGLTNPSALTNFYMDTFMCTEFHLKS